MRKPHDDGFFKAYEEYSKVLRTWFVAYGIGAPVVFLTNEVMSKTVLNSPNAPYIGGAFLIGVALQVILAAVNKHCMWALYYGDTETTFQKTSSYRIANWISERIWIDLTADVITFALFARATWLAYELLMIGRH
jgi:hypothetical protein